MFSKPENHDVITPGKIQNLLKLLTLSRRKDAVKLKGGFLLTVVHRGGGKYPGKTINNYIPRVYNVQLGVIHI